LDDLYEQGGALVKRRLELLKGDNARPPIWRRRWTHHYPASYVGDIFMRIVLPPGQVPARIGVGVEWGRWQLQQRVWAHDEDGCALAHTKGDDELSLPVFVTTDRPSIVEFYTGAPPPGAIDINHGWTKRLSARDT